MSNLNTTASKGGILSRLIKWLRSGKGQRCIIMITFMTVPLLLLIGFAYLPFFKMFEFSFFNMKYIGERKFIGLDNYRDVLADKEVMNSLMLAVYYLIGSFIQLALALYFATMLSFKTKGGSFFKGTIFFPYLISGIAMGFIFKFFYTRGFVFDTVLTRLGFELENLPYWLRDKGINNVSLVATSVWKYMGQNMVLLSVQLCLSIRSSMNRPAWMGQTDGTSFVILFCRALVDHCFKHDFIYGFTSAFEPPYVITGGTRGTATFFLLMHNMAHRHQKVGKASAMALILFSLIIIVTIAQKLIFKYVFSDSNEDVSKKTARMLRKQRAKEAMR